MEGGKGKEKPTSRVSSESNLLAAPRGGVASAACNVLPGSDGAALRTDDLRRVWPRPVVVIFFVDARMLALSAK